MAFSADLDELMAAAWPASMSETHDGWVFRFTHGVTRRANSVLVRGEPSDLHGAVFAAERFYEQREARPVFLVSDASAPVSVMEHLVRRGYHAEADTWILHGDSTTVAAKQIEGREWNVHVSEEPGDQWLDAYWSVEAGRKSASDRSIVRDVLLRPAAPSVFVGVGNDDGVVSVGQAVLQGGWACLQCLATSPAGRRQGAGSRVVRQLAAEAADRGATGVFAAVMASNAASLSLFERLALHKSHQYRYFMK
jgi:N-acetylglutamate synthase